MQNINVNIVPDNFPQTIRYSQGDIGRQFKINVADFDIPVGATVKIQATKPSGFGFSVAGVVSDNSVTFTTTEEMTDEAGRFQAELQITSGGDVIGTANFLMIGERNPHPEGTTDGSQGTIIPELTLLVERVEKAASDILDMNVEAETLPAGSQAGFLYDEETNTATFFIPEGQAGAGAAGVVASAYSAAKTYKVGDYVLYNSNLYRCTTAITTAEAWTAAHWTQIVLADDVTDLKTDLNSVKDGERVYTKDEVLGFDVISTATIYSCQNVVIGTTTLSQITTSGSGADAKAIKVPLKGVKKISYPVWKTTQYWGSFIFDDNDVVLWDYFEDLADTGTIKTIDVPEGASYMLLSLSATLVNTIDWNVTLYYEASLDDIIPIKDRFALKYEHGANLLNLSALISGKYINTTNGKEAVGSSFKVTDFIPINSEYVIIAMENRSLSDFSFQCAFYDENKVFIQAGIIPVSIYNPYYGINYNFRRITAPNGAKYVRISSTSDFFNSAYNPMITEGYYEQAVKGYKAPEELFDNDVLDDRFDSALTESIGKMFNNSWNSLSLSPSNEYKLGVESSVKGEETLFFFAKIVTMGELKFGLKDSSYTLHVDGTDYWFGDDENPYKYAHGLTMKDYISVIIQLDGDGANSHIKIYTNGGVKTINNTTFVGTTGRPTIKSIGFTGSYCRASWMCKASRPIWIFGDSYISSYSPARWSYYLFDWGLDSNVLMNGYAGQTAQTAIRDFEHLLEIGNPRYAVWCLGMNNGDDGAVNSDWLTATQKFIALCEANNIVPILATIPNVPSVTHTYKNAWIKASGYRYVDFASAVNGESAGATWFDGMLAPSPDLVHPTAQGAICLANEFVMSVPEVTYK